MKTVGLEVVQAEITAANPVKWVGRTIEVGRGTVSVSGLSAVAALGDLVEIQNSTGDTSRGEVLSLGEDHIIVLPDGIAEGLRIGDRVLLLGQNEIAPHESWVGRMIDPYGNAIDGTPVLRGPISTALRGQPMNPAERRGLGARLETGLAIFNTMLPIVRGQRIGLFAGSGVGKSTLLGKLATGVQADIVVIAMIGERGREVREFVERILGPVGMERAIVVAATSDQSPLTRRRCAWTAMTVAEFFRDQGKHVLFVADSITRFAEAHREVALSIGEPGTLRGFPPSTAHTITALCERAGPGLAHSGDITAIFSVLVAGSDMEEPVADILRGVLDGHVILDRQIAERGRFPAIDPIKSVSRSLPLAASADENQLINLARERLGKFGQNEMMIRAGLYAKGSDTGIDAAIATWPALDAFVGESEHKDIAASFQKLAECLKPDQPEITPDDPE